MHIVYNGYHIVVAGNSGVKWNIVVMAVDG